ncbi:MAG: glycerophosphodiester phosphodiesterase family protein [Pseudomonadota bacterium]
MSAGASSSKASSAKASTGANGAREQTRIAAHRGAVDGAPENTLAAFDRATSIGADLIEVDLRVTADGHIVVLHDSRVNRTTDGRGKVRKMTLAELRRLDAGRGQVVPTLEETLAFVGGRNVGLLLDVKDSRRMDPMMLAAAIDRHGLSDRVLIGTRSLELAQALRALDPELKLLAMVKSPARMDDYLALDVHAVRLWSRWLRSSPSLADEIGESGAEVWVMTGGLKGRRLAQALRQADGVITDHPEHAQALLPERRLATAY